MSLACRRHKSTHPAGDPESWILDSGFWKAEMPDSRELTSATVFSVTRIQIITWTFYKSRLELAEGEPI